jgi:hypothetical protein
MTDRLAIAGTVLLASATLGGMLLAFASGGMGPFPAWGGMALGVGAAWLSINQPHGPHLSWNPWDLGMALAFGLAGWRAFLWLLYESGGSLYVNSPYNLGDLSLHLQMVNGFLLDGKLWPESFLFAGEPLRYAPGINWFHAMTAEAGWPVRQGFAGMGLIATALLAATLHRWGGAFAMALFLFGGGLTGFVFLTTGVWSDYQAEQDWKNPFLTLWVTQRGFLFALPAGLLLLASWRSRMQGSSPLLPGWIEWLLYSAMPVFHPHSFLFLSLVLPFLLAGELATKSFHWKTIAGSHWVRLVTAAFPMATLLTFLVTGGFSGGGDFAWNPGWMPGGDRLWYWINNFGIYPLLVVISVFLAIRNQEKTAVLFLTPAILIFGACLLFRFAPWAWDNTKLMIWSWIATAPFVWNLVLRPAHWLVRTAICGVLFFPGTVSLIGGLGPEHQYRLASLKELTEVEEALRLLPSDAVFLVSPEFHHPVSLLGRRVYAGYDGHLWSHGYDYVERFRSLEKVFSHGEPPPDVNPERVVWFLGHREWSRFGQPATDRGWEKIVTGHGFEILAPSSAQP